MKIRLIKRGWNLALLVIEQKRSIVKIDLSIDAYIPPSDYIEDERQKIDFYKRIQRIDGVEDHDEIDVDLIDRFGDYPQEVSDLLEVGLIQKLCREESDRNDQTPRRDGRHHLLAGSDSPCRGPAVFEALSKIPLKAQVNLNNAKLVVSLIIRKLLEPQWHEPSQCNFVKALIVEPDEKQRGTTDGK